MEPGDRPWSAKRALVCDGTNWEARKRSSPAMHVIGGGEAQTGGTNELLSNRQKVDSGLTPASKHSSQSGFPDMQDPSRMALRCWTRIWEAPETRKTSGRAFASSFSLGKNGVWVHSNVLLSSILAFRAGP
jgi:hypothetical protein